MPDKVQLTGDQVKLVEAVNTAVAHSVIVHGYAMHASGMSERDAVNIMGRLLVGIAWNAARIEAESREEPITVEAFLAEMKEMLEE